MRKQHSYEDRLKYMKMLEEGYGQYYVHRVGKFVGYIHDIVVA